MLSCKKSSPKRVTTFCSGMLSRNYYTQEVCKHVVVLITNVKDFAWNALKAILYPIFLKQRSTPRSPCVRSSRPRVIRSYVLRCYGLKSEKLQGKSSKARILYQELASDVHGSVQRCVHLGLVRILFLI